MSHLKSVTVSIVPASNHSCAGVVVTATSTDGEQEKARLPLRTLGLGSSASLADISAGVAEVVAGELVRQRADLSTRIVRR